MKKALSIICVLLMMILLVSLYNSNAVCYAKNTIEEELSDYVNEQLSIIDFFELDKILDNYSGYESNIIDSNSFYDKVVKIINGDLSLNYNNLFEAFINIALDYILEIVPLLCTIVSIVILGSFISQLRSSIGSKSVNDVVHFVCYGIIIVLISTVVTKIIGITTDTLLNMKSQMEIIFPILLTLMSAVGGAVSVGIYQPAIVLLSSGIMEIFNAIILPLFILIFIFTIVQNISNTIKFDKFISFFSSSFKWIIGCVFTIFFAFLTIQGITANTYDGISIRTVKYTVKSYVPYLGGYLSDGFDLLLSSSIIIKNAIGITGVVLLLITILSPLVNILIFMFGLKLVSAILEPIADSRISNFLHNVAKSLSMLIACIIGVAFMYLISIGLIMCTCNIV